MYIHIPKEKRTKLDPSSKKGILIGYSDTSKAYQIYFLGFKKIDISRDVTFDEDSTYSKFRKLPIEEVEEPEGTRVQGTKIVEAIPEVHEDHDMEIPQEIVEKLHEIDSSKRKQHGHRNSCKKKKGMVLHMGCKEKGKYQNLTTSMWPCCVTSLTRNLPNMKRLQKINNGKISLSRSTT